MPLSTSPAVTERDLEHTFHFDPTFRNVHLPSDCELRFFSEMLSLVDSMRNVDLLHNFSERIRKTKGVLTCKDLIEMFREENLIESSSNSLSSNKDEGLQFLLDNIYLIVNRIVMDRFVSCMATSTLGCIAFEVGQLYLDQTNNNDDNPKTISSNPGACSYLKEKSKAWLELAQRFHDLSKHQHISMKIHHDFQKSNYAPDPRSKYAYGSTIAVLFIGFLYLLLKNVKIAEAKELVYLLRK